MSHPLLTKWLADNLPTPSDCGSMSRQEIVEYVMYDEDDIADRLERALDVCQYLMADPTGGPPFNCGLREMAHGIGLMDSHPFVPLVTP